MENMETAVIVLITGLVVVFTVLILLTLVIKLYSTLVHNALHRSPKKTETKQEPQKAAAPQPGQVAPAPAAPQIESGISGEVVAAIAAAVSYAGEENQTAYAVKGIKRSAGSRPVWSMAGLMENTRPF